MIDCGLNKDGLRRSVARGFRRRQAADPLEWLPWNVRFPFGFEATAFDFDTAPHVRGVIQRFWMDPRRRKANLCWATRLCKSSTMLSLACHVAAEDPAPMVMLFPDQGTLNSALSEHIYPMFEETRAIRRQLPPAHRQNRRAIRFNDCNLRLACAGTPSSVSGFPARFVFKFEHEKIPTPSAADREADSSKRVESRASGYSRGTKILEEGTPVKADDSRVHKLLQSPHVMQLLYHVPCPHCQEYQPLEFERLKWDRDSTGQHSPAIAQRTAWYECQHCGGRIENHHRVAMMRAGRWLSEGEYCDVAGNICGRPEVDSDTMVFGPLSKLYSLLTAGFGDVAREFVEALEAQRQGDLDAMFKFHTETLGKVWIQRAVAVPDNELAEHLRGTHKRGHCPEETAFLTTFADIGYAGNQILFHWMVCAWWAKRQGAIVDFGLASGVEEFVKLLGMSYPVDGSGVLLPVSEFPVGLDSSAYSTEVYSLCDQFGANVIPMKGDSRTGNNVSVDLYYMGYRSADVSAKVRKFRKDLGLGDLMMVNSEETQKYRIALIEKRLHPGYAGFLRLPWDLCDEWQQRSGWFRQLSSDYKDGGKWKRNGPNEAGDQIRMNRALAEYYTQNGASWDTAKLPARFRVEPDELKNRGRMDRPVQPNVFHESRFLLSQR